MANIWKIIKRLGLIGLGLINGTTSINGYFLIIFLGLITFSMIILWLRIIHFILRVLSFRPLTEFKTLAIDLGQYIFRKFSAFFIKYI